VAISLFAGRSEEQEGIGRTSGNVHNTTILHTSRLLYRWQNIHNAETRSPIEHVQTSNLVIVGPLGRHLHLPPEFFGVRTQSTPLAEQALVVGTVLYVFDDSAHVDLSVAPIGDQVLWIHPDEKVLSWAHYVLA
jgi:hypothetical protein